ncbi:MAG TPA: SCO1664 family protein [Acidimicrobiales bacterium]|nr:SCO1664 family protein [Acidimicrobiales bacterium]
MPADERQPVADTLSVLADGEVEILGRMPWSSNATFLVNVSLGSAELRAIYKPHRGERELWDFPDGLYRREAAAYRLAEALGWPPIPETIVRTEAPFGEGSLQRFIDADYDEHYFTLLEEPRHRPALQAMAAFDVVANNADRKGGHCLLDHDDRIWGIDHGLCFNVAPKLRTVIWDFAGEEIPAALREDLRRLAVAPPATLAALLSPAERLAVQRRASRAADRGVYPQPAGDRPYPWPLV